MFHMHLLTAQAKSVRCLWEVRVLLAMLGTTQSLTLVVVGAPYAHATRHY